MFIGYNYNSELDLVYYNYRHYSPDLGRFLSRDPIEEQGGLNLYAFVGNQIWNWVDYLGENVNPCTGTWFNFSVFAEHSENWLAEIGSGNISWYGISAIKVCTSINIGVRGKIKCECCGVDGIDVYSKINEVKDVCLDLEIPWTMAITIAIVAGVPIPGTTLLAIAGIGAFAFRALQKLRKTYQRLNTIIDAKNKFENFVKNDTGIPTDACNSHHR